MQVALYALKLDIPALVLTSVTSFRAGWLSHLYSGNSKDQGKPETEHGLDNVSSHCKISTETQGETREKHGERSKRMLSLEALKNEGLPV